MRVNKYLYYYVVQGHYGVLGWEDIWEGEDYQDARARLQEYRIEYPHRLIKRREPNPNWTPPDNYEPWPSDYVQLIDARRDDRRGALLCQTLP